MAREFGGRTRSRPHRLALAACIALTAPTCATDSTSAAARQLSACRASLAQPDDIATIAGIVRHINALPQPATAACFIASLPRPLSIVATSSTASAQPAAGVRAPRIFIVLPTISFSVVSDGGGAHLLELGEWIDTRHTLKGEIELPPAERPLAVDAPFTRVRYGTGTTCGLCHREERASTSVASGFTSLAYQPIDTSLVDLATVRAIPDAVCADEHDVTPPCLFWHALFDYGEIRQGAFDPGLSTLFH
jgi:hypothetical protein